MFIRNGMRFDVRGSYVIDGETFGAGAFLDPLIRQRMGVVLVDDPVPPDDYSDDTYYRTEQDDAPYVVYTRKSDEQIAAVMAKKFEQALDNHLDSVAQEHRYNDRFTFALRAGYIGPFQAEGIAFATWMDTCNATGYQLLVDVQSGTKPMPASPQEFIDSLLVFVWPIPEEVVTP